MFTINTFIEGKPQKITAAITLSFFAWVFFLSPNALAVKEEVNKEDKRQAAIEKALDKTPEHAYARRLQKLKEYLTFELPLAKEKAEKDRKKETFGEVKAWLNEYGLFLPPVLTKEQKDTIRALQEEINELAEESLQGFDTVAEHIYAKDLPEVAMKRHQAVVDQVDQRYAAFNNKVEAVLSAEDRKEEKKALDKLTRFIEQQQFSKSHDKTNLDKMPFGTPASKVRKPHKDSVSLQQYLKIPFQQLAALNSTGLLENTRVPAAADLAENIEIKLTDAIKARAAELNHNPVEIYTWVHNNVQYVPSFGSIQGADYTLQSLKGNSFDTASLLIALLRASDIPARYAYGTVDVPIEKANNWVGGTNSVNATLDLMAQGGIPSTLLKVNGQNKAVRMEHVWVEAFVDYEPSRGVNHAEGDNWIPMDASFKQYDYSEGMPVEENVPFDAEGLLQTIQNNATINEAEGWIQNVPQAAVESQLETFQSQIQSYIEQQNPDATFGDVLGLQEIKVKSPQPLAAGLPYRLVTAKQTFSEMPGHLRHKFVYKIVNPADRIGNYFEVIKPTAELAGKKLALSFRPSTEDDEAIILSYLPEVPEGEELDPADLPRSLPGYLINMTAEFTIDGEAVASADVGTMGSDLIEYMDYQPPSGSNDFPPTKNTILIGEYQAIGLNLQGISSDQLQSLQADIETTKAKLEAYEANPDDLSGIETLTKHQLVGDLLQATIQSYWAMNDIQDQLTQQVADASIYRYLSFGKFSTALQPTYNFGVPTKVAFSGMLMDVDHAVSQIIDHGHDADKKGTIQKAIGTRLSVMEHQVPEMLLSTAENSVSAVSAVRALRLASTQGQKIFTINQGNLDSALSEIEFPAAVEQEIRNAVLYAGKEVTTHTHLINYQGIVTGGYLIIDPETGAGAYKITSGQDGADVSFSEVFVEHIMMFGSALGSQVNDIALGTVNIIDLGLFVLGLVGDTLLSAIAAGISFTSAYDSLVNGNCVGNVFGALATALILSAIPIVISLLFTVTFWWILPFALITLYVYEDWEARCGI